jgi:methyl-accepting chemotaxis protein
MNRSWSLNVKFAIISVAFTLPAVLLWAFVHMRVETLHEDPDYYQVLVFAALGWLLCNGLALILLRGIIRSLRAIADELQEVTRETLGSSHELDESSKKSAAAAHQEATAIQESVTAMTEMTSMLGQTGQHTRATKEVAEHSLGRAQEGAQTMEKLAQSMQHIAQANTNLKDIGSIIESIAVRTTVINDIVFKTQLLSVNASIEAARAGHHGKGFAVVAGEVASLANLSGKAAEEIRELLKKSRGEVAQILASTQESIVSGQSVVGDALESFEAITSAMNHINEKVQQIFEATREQEIGVKQTSDALAELNRATSAQSLLASRNTKLSEHLKQQGYHLRRIERAMSFVIAGEASQLSFKQGLHPQQSAGLSSTLTARTVKDDPSPLLQPKSGSENAVSQLTDSASRKAELAIRIVRKAHSQDEERPLDHRTEPSERHNVG